jgi:hypothetical protein
MRSSPGPDFPLPRIALHGVDIISVDTAFLIDPPPGPFERVLLCGLEACEARTDQPGTSDSLCIPHDLGPSTELGVRHPICGHVHDVATRVGFAFALRGEAHPWRGRPRDGLRGFHRGARFDTIRHNTRRILELPCDLSERIGGMGSLACAMRCLPGRLTCPEHLAKALVLGLAVNGARLPMPRFQPAIRTATERAAAVRKKPVHFRQGAGRTPLFEPRPARRHRRIDARQPGPGFAGHQYPQHGIRHETNLRARPAALPMNHDDVNRQNGRQQKPLFVTDFVEMHAVSPYQLRYAGSISPFTLPAVRRPRCHGRQDEEVLDAIR